MSDQRKEQVKKEVKRALEVVEKMKKSTDMDYILECVVVSENLTLEINCIRNDYEDSVCYGEAMYFEVYALDGNNTAVDCMTISMYRNLEEDLTYLINCYM